MAESKGLRLLGQIPIVQSIMEAGETGQPAACDENSLVGQAFLTLAENVVDTIGQMAETAKRVRVQR